MAADLPAPFAQLRLDFHAFVIAGPDTSTASFGMAVAGSPIIYPGGTLNHALSVTTASQCLADAFVVTNPGGNAPPVICGANSREHSRATY